MNVVLVSVAVVSDVTVVVLVTVDVSDEVLVTVDDSDVVLVTVDDSVDEVLVFGSGGTSCCARLGV